MKWRDVRVGDVVVSVNSRVACCLFARVGRMYTWFVLDSEDHDPLQRPGSLFTTEAKAFDVEIEDWVVFKGSKP